MDFLFITRCTVPDNLEIIKRNLQERFQSGGDIYKHHIICDLTGGVDKAAFESCADDVTKLTYVTQKKLQDKYCSEYLDKAVAQYPDTYWVYVLDDDNILKNNFLDVKEFCNGNIQIVIFDAQRSDGNTRLCRPRGLSPKHCLNYIDFANMLIRNSTAKKLGFFAKNSFACDGLFMKKALEQHIPYINTEKCFAYYNKLKNR